MEKQFPDEDKEFVESDDGDVEEIEDGLVDTHSCTNVAHQKYIRNIESYLLPAHAPDSRWVFNRINKFVRVLNSERYNFDIEGLLEPLQLTRYDEKGFYSDHIDLGGNYPESRRKFSFSIQLSNSDEYEGGEVIIKKNHQKKSISKEVGSITLWPSYFLHNVQPVLGGTRWSLVGWISGPGHFK